jgi:hypothetical protein
MGRLVSSASSGATATMTYTLIGQSNSNYTWSGFSSTGANTYFNTLSTISNQWWQIADNGTTRTIKFGVDGINFPVTLISISSTAAPFNVTPVSNYGVFCGAQNAVTGSNPWGLTLISDN